MKSQAITEYGQPLTLVESETPKPVGSEILLKVTHCGVCHSDVHIHDGHFDMGGDNKGLSAAYMVQAVEASLKRLQSDYIDLYQSHRDDETTPLINKAIGGAYPPGSTFKLAVTLAGLERSL